MPNSNYLSQSEEEQARKEYLANRTFDTVNTGSSGSGRKFTFRKFNNIVQEIAQGLNVATTYNPGSQGVYPQQNQYQPNMNIRNANQGKLPWILGITIVGAGIAYIVKQQS